MNASHVIARCAWQSTFDHQNKVGELQSFISRWSNEVLTEELDRCFNTWCPSIQTWRIDALHLDVGDIAFENLAEELPTRLRESLNAAMERLLTNRHVSHEGGSGGHLQMLEAREVQQEVVAWFLQTGTLPWWFKGHESALQILDEQIEHQREATAEIIRDLGRVLEVRKRLVRQCGEPRVRAVIHLIEPWHGDFICQFADNLFAVHAERQIPRTGAAEYREHTWLNILTFLLVDRGSLFNTAAFVQANLQETARRYQLDYQTLLQHIAEAVHELETRGLVTHTVFGAIKTIFQRDRDMAHAPVDTEVARIDPWAALRAMLRRARGRDWVGAELVHTEELFSVLAREDAQRMASLLREEGRAASVRNGLLKHFTFEGLADIVQVLEPQEQPFIVAYVRHTQSQAELLHWDKQSVWEVVFTYLLAEQSTHFNRRQLIADTLQKLSRTHGMTFSDLLDVLIHALHERYASTRYFELLDIFRDLKNEQRRRTQSQQRQANAEQALGHALLHYLQTGLWPAGAQHGSHQGISPSSTPRWATLHAAMPAQTLAAVLSTEELSAEDDSALATRLLTLAGTGDLSLLFNAIEPGAAEFCLPLMHQLMVWWKRGALPCLAGVDLAFELPVLLLASLSGLRQRNPQGQRSFNQDDCWRQFLHLLSKRRSVDVAMLQAQLRHCLSADYGVGSVDTVSLLTLQRLLSASNAAGRQTDDAPDTVGMAKPPVQQRLTGTASIQEAPNTQMARFLERRSLSAPEQSLLARLPQIEAGQWNVMSAIEKARQLIVIAGAADLSLLFELAERGSATFCMAMLRQLADWHKQARLPSLGNIDLDIQLPALLLSALLVFRGAGKPNDSRFDAARFWGCFLLRLQGMPYVDSAAFCHELRRCLDQDASGRWTTALDTGDRPLEDVDSLPLSDLLRALVNETIQEQTSRRAMTAALSAASEPVIQGESGSGSSGDSDNHSSIDSSNDSDNHSSSGEVQSVAVLLEAMRGQLGLSKSAPSLSQRDVAKIPESDLWESLATANGDAIRRWLSQQTDRQHLLDRLVRTDQIASVQHALVAYLPDEIKAPEESVRHLVRLLEQSGHWHGATAVLAQELRAIFWSTALDGAERSWSSGEFLAAILTTASYRLAVPLSACMEGLRQQIHLRQSAPWREADAVLSKCLKRERDIESSPSRRAPVGVTHRPAGEGAEFHQDPLARYLDHPDFLKIARHWLLQGRPPAGAAPRLPIDLGRLLFDVLTHRPTQAAELLNSIQGRPDAMIRVLNIVSLEWLLEALRPPDAKTVPLLRQLQRLALALDLGNVCRQERLVMLTEMVLSYWLANDWAALSPDRLVSDYLWRLMCRRQVSRNELRERIAPLLAGQPASLRRLLEMALGEEATPQPGAHRVQKDHVDHVSHLKASHQNAASLAEKRLAAAIKAVHQPKNSALPVAVPNCGLVLLQSFIPMFLSRLGLTEGEQFVSPEAQRRAVHLLQFLVTGQCATAEEHLSLNKVLCGLPLHEPVEAGIEITDKEVETSKSLLNAVIGYWDVIAGSSLDGLRGNWLVRAGTLTDAQERWDLIVEKRVYDLLLARSPFSYSVIKFPWMEKAMYVTWPT